jgi:DNA polymerase-3 subunit beta
MITGSVTAKPQAFAAAVKWAAKFLDARPSVPIHAGLMLDAEGGRLRITAMNEYTVAVATLPVDGDGKGRAVVSGRLLSELAGTFADKTVELAGADGEDVISLAAGRWRGTLPTMSEQDYPAVPGYPEVIGTVGGEQFARVIAEVAAATDDSREATSWRSVHLTVGADRIDVIGTDSYRAAGSTARFVPAGDGIYGSALVLASAMVDVAAGFIGPDEIEVGLSDSQISMASATRSVVMRLMDGKDYPAADVAALIAKQQPEHAIVRVADLTGPLKRAAAMRDKEGPVAVGFAEGLMTINSEAGDLHRKGDEEIDIDYTGPEVVLHFNPQYFADALASAPGELVDLALTEKTGRGGRPGQVGLTVEGNPWRHVLMPITPMGK